LCKIGKRNVINVSLGRGGATECYAAVDAAAAAAGIRCSELAAAAPAASIAHRL